MGAVIRIPKLGLSEYAELVAWEVDVGEPVSEGETVALLESDKASAEIESPADGVLLATYAEAGSEIAVEVGTPLGFVGGEGESPPSLAEIEADAGSTNESAAAADGEAPATATGRAQSAADEVKATPRAKRDAGEHDVDLSEVEGTGPEGAVNSDDVRRYLDAGSPETGAGIEATPRAKQAARERGLDVGDIDGTGPRGAVTVEDVERRAADESSDSTEPDGADGLTVTESNELAGTRRTIAERLSRSAREKPHVTGTREIRIDRLEAIRDRLRVEYDLDVSLNDLLLYFVGRVLRDLPAFNARFEDGRHEFIEEVNVGYAVDGPRGLTVPVVERVAERSLSDLAAERRALVGRVLDDEHAVEDLRGGTFTVTNVGAFGMDISCSIINPPEVAILAIGRRKYAPVEDDGDVEFRRVATFSLTIDHRVLDGADSGAFLDRLAEYLGYPGAVLDDLGDA